MNEQQNAAFNDQIITKQNHLPPKISRIKHADTSDPSAKKDNNSLNENKSKNNSLFPNNGARGGRMSVEQPQKTPGFLCEARGGCGGLL